ncbi:hypothetical protein [Croceibacterium mercuriale]|uniref:hypothetical protein n=1 Tax=Croceibacterium mercuriale TaxID=1572751 RepID=UPI00126A56C5|nr:hypothetical protein [Croceibacterium mercuriale]
MLIAPFLLMAAEVACPTAPERIEISAVQIDGEDIGGATIADAPDHYRLGDLVYQGHGIKIVSSDPRFQNLVLDQQAGLRHQCGNIVFLPSGWNATDPDLAQRKLDIQARVSTRQSSPGSIAAGQLGAGPLIDGYMPGPSWPVYSDGKFFLGLMYPETGAASTAVVAFASLPSLSPAFKLAELPMKLDTLSVVPDIHGPNRYINLTSLDEEGTTHIVLLLDQDTVLNIEHDLSELNEAGDNELSGASSRGSR